MQKNTSFNTPGYTYEHTTVCKYEHTSMYTVPPYVSTSHRHAQTLHPNSRILQQSIHSWGNIVLKCGTAGPGSVINFSIFSSSTVHSSPNIMHYHTVCCLLQSVCCRWCRGTTTTVYLIGPLRRKIYSFFGRGQTSVFEKIEKNLRWDWQQRSRTSSQFIFIFKITWEEANQPGLRRSRLLVDTTGLRMCARRVAMSRKKPIFFQVKMMRQSTK